jgi:hypothetical protein
MIDILPYFADVEKNPHAEENKNFMASLDIWKHQKIGPNENNYICPARTFKQPCPICELQAEMRAMGTYTDEELKALNPSRRLIYNIHVLDNDGEKRKGVRVWEVSQYLFGQELDDLADGVGKKVHYASPKVGKSISFKRKGTGGMSTKFTAFEFVPRAQNPSDAILDAVFTLEDLMYFAPYKEMVASLPRNEVTERLFFGKTVEKEPAQEEKEAVSNEKDVVDPNECPFEHEFGEDNGNLMIVKSVITMMLAVSFLMKWKQTKKKKKKKKPRSAWKRKKLLN